MTAILGHCGLHGPERISATRRAIIPGRLLCSKCPLRTFGTLLERPDDRSQSLRPETSQSGDMTSLGAATGVPRPGRTLSWDGGVAGSARTGVDSPAHLAALEILLVTSLAGLSRSRASSRSNSAAAPSTCSRNRNAGFWRSPPNPWVTAMNRMLLFSRILMLPPVNRQNDPASIREGNRFFLLRRPLSDDSARGSVAFAALLTSSQISTICRRWRSAIRRVHGLVLHSAGQRSIP